MTGLVNPMGHKVLFIHHGGGIGGAPVSMLQLATALDRKCYAPLAIFTQPGPILGFACEFDVPVRMVPLHSAFFYSAHVPIRLRMLFPFLLYFWQTVRATGALVRQERPDLVHLNTSVLIPEAIAVKREGIPLVWHVREVPGANPLLRRWQTRTLVGLADHIIVNSEYVRGAFPPDARVTVVHNALDLGRFHINEEVTRIRIREELGLSSSALVVGMIGSVQAVKGHYLLVEAAQKVAQSVPEVRFLVVAGNPARHCAQSWKGRVKTALGAPLDNLDRMRRLIAKMRMERHFVFTSFRSDIPEVLAAMDILAFLPQAAEGFGRPLIEAMAMGRAIVTTDVGPSREITGEEAGWRLPVADPHALADALITLLTDKPKRLWMGGAGRKRVTNKFNLTQHAQRIEMIYDKVLAGNGSRRWPLQ